MDLKSFISELGKLKPDRSLVTLTSDGLTVQTLGGQSLTLADCDSWDSGFIWVDKATLSKMAKILKSLAKSYPRDCLNLTMETTTIGQWELSKQADSDGIVREAYRKKGESDRPSLLLTMGGSSYNIAGIGDLGEFAAAINRPDQFPRLQSNVSLFSLPSEFFHLAIKAKLQTAEILCRDGKLYLYCPDPHQVLCYEDSYHGTDKTAKIDIGKIKAILPKNGPVEFSTTENYHGLLVGSHLVGELFVDLAKMKTAAIEYCKNMGGDPIHRLRPEWFSLVKNYVVEIVLNPSGDGIVYGYGERDESLGEHGFSHVNGIAKIDRIPFNPDYVKPLAVKSDLIEYVELERQYLIRGRIDIGIGYVYWVVATVQLSDRRPLPSHWQQKEQPQKNTIDQNAIKRYAPQNAIAHFEKVGKWPKWFRPSIRVRSELALLGAWPHAEK